MHWQFTPYAIPEAISGAIVIWLVIVTWRRRSASGASPFIVILLAAAVYSLSYMVELGSTDLSAALFWNNVAWLGQFSCRQLGLPLRFNTRAERAG